MSVPHKCERVKGTATTRIIHPDTGDELGRFAEIPGVGWVICLPGGDGNLVGVPDVYATRHDARRAILEAHEPEPE
jgi:hypothetical protein